MNTSKNLLTLARYARSVTKDPMAESKDDDYDPAGLDAIASVESPEKLAIQRKVGKWAAMNMNPVALLKHAADRLAEWQGTASP